ncbi:MAG: S8 family serine peptidase [Dissulfurimicrobium hydrothermale]|uniref:S8 family serine peptidase n=1 Tax=Dissulfurimicrobium hydrothermale TaxID=1750598 RepID=UPI003C7601E5
MDYYQIRLFLSLLLIFFCTGTALANDGVSPKIDPFLQNELNNRTASESIEVILVLDRDPLAQMPEDLVREMKDRIEGLGGSVSNYAFNNIKATVPVDKISEIAKWPEIKVIKLPTRPHVSSMSEGVGVIGADRWQNSGLLGQGVKVGIIDVGFKGWESAGLTRYYPLKVFGGDENSDTHGAECAALVHDVAPGAMLYLANIGNADTDLYNAYSWLKSQGVEVISCSLGWDWWWLLSGQIDQQTVDQLHSIVEQAHNDGITWVNAAGNKAQQIWLGQANLDQYNYVNFTSGWEVNPFILSKHSDSSPSSGQALVWLIWFNPSANYDLNIYRWNGQNWDIVAHSVSVGTGLKLCLFQGNRYDITGDIYAAAIKGGWGSSSQDWVGLILDSLDDLQPSFDPSFGGVYTRTYSIDYPADDPAVLTVGAVPYNNPYQTEKFSSCGPTLSGGAKPDIVAPDCVTTWFGGNFCGTSAAAPYAAGAVALLKQAHPEWGPDQIKSMLKATAYDIAPAGWDYCSGAGLMQLGGLLGR